MNKWVPWLGPVEQQTTQCVMALKIQVFSFEKEGIWIYCHLAEMFAKSLNATNELWNLISHFVLCGLQIGEKICLKSLIAGQEEQISTILILWCFGIKQKCKYSVVNFLKNINKRHPLAHPLRWGMGCLLWFQHLIDILPQFLKLLMLYLTVLDCVIMALDYTCLSSSKESLCKVLIIF